MDKNGTAVSDIPADAFPGACSLVLVSLACREGIIPITGIRKICTIIMQA
jgi:hypothetical protein